MTRGAATTEPSAIVLFSSLGVVVAIVGSLWVSAHLGVALGDPATPIPANPLVYVLRLLLGDASWPGGYATAVTALLLLAALALAWLVALVIAHVADRDRTIDGRARYLSGRRGIRHSLSRKAAARKAAQLRHGRLGTDPAEHGIYLGDLVRGRRQGVYCSFEDTIVVIAGPRVGKSTALVIPTVLNSPGAVVVTSNKRDVHDATRAVRVQRGQVWCFDPQGIVGSDPDFFFDPLSEVGSIDDARELAAHFAMSVRTSTSRTDAYFDTEAENLLSRLFLAAARSQNTLLDAYRWLQNPYDSTPVTYLWQAGDVASAEALDATSQLADKQRDGVYGTARSLVRCLENPAITRWIVPPLPPRLPRFDPASFVASVDTLYSLSEEGEGSAGPLVAALTQAIFNAGRRAATTSPGGRLDPPLISVLDEAANVVRLRKLPSQYSHFGSQGLPVMTVLQSWPQGTDVWGDSGMRALWGASTVRLYLGGAADSGWLDQLSNLIGDHDRRTTSYSYDARFTRSRSVSTRRERIYSTADLASLPKGRAIALIAGHDPMLLRTTPWMRTRHAAPITDSLRTWNPQNESA